MAGSLQSKPEVPVANTAVNAQSFGTAVDNLTNSNVFRGVGQSVDNLASNIGGRVQGFLADANVVSRNRDDTIRFLAELDSSLYSIFSQNDPSSNKGSLFNMAAARARQNRPNIDITFLSRFNGNDATSANLDAVDRTNGISYHFEASPITTGNHPWNIQSTLTDTRTNSVLATAVRNAPPVSTLQDQGFLATTAGGSNGLADQGFLATSKNLRYDPVFYTRPPMHLLTAAYPGQYTTLVPGVVVTERYEDYPRERHHKHHRKHHH